MNKLTPNKVVSKNRIKRFQKKLFDQFGTKRPGNRQFSYKFNSLKSIKTLKTAENFLFN